MQGDKRKANLHFFCLGLIALFFISCSTTRRLPPDGVLLQRNNIQLDQAGIDREALGAIVKQRPNGRILGLPINLYIFNWGRQSQPLDKPGFFSRIGEPPVVLDSLATLRSFEQMKLYLQGQGYFQVSGTYAIQPHPRNKKKARVTYDFQLGQRYRIASIQYQIQNIPLRNLTLISQNDRAIQPNDPYNANKLEEERDRLSKLYREHGYFDFPKDLIRVEVDTLSGPDSVRLNFMVLNYPQPVGDSLTNREHQTYSIGHVYILPDFDYVKGFNRHFDTINFEGYRILYPAGITYDPRLFHDVVHIEPGTLFKEAKVRQTYSHINALRVFRSAEIAFERQDSQPQVLDAFVKLAPFDKRSFTTEFQSINTSGNFGISGNLGWLSRNTFKGGEVLEFRFGGGIDAQANFRDATDRVFNTTQVQGEISITFPRFILPIQTLKVFPKDMAPTTRISMSYSRQVRLEFDRAVFNLGLRYQWRESATKTHNLSLIDLNYLNAIRVDQVLLDNLLFVNNFQDNFISAIRYAFTYNEQVFKKARHQNYFAGGVEFSGNFISVFDEIRDFPVNADGRSEIFGVPYAQYARFDADYRHFWNLPFDQQLVFRLLGGLSFGYNNSRFGAPFEKLFFAGGSYDIRAWRAYNLGPGSVPESIFETIPRARYVATAPIKLMTNVEYRFPLSRTLPFFKDIKGAVFTDIGNIWWNRAAAGQFQEGDLFEPYLDDFLFDVNRFYKQLAVGGGIGFRYDLTFFVLRLDTAYKLRDPAKPAGETWLAHPLNFGSLTYNIAIGYPF